MQKPEGVVSQLLLTRRRIVKAISALPVAGELVQQDNSANPPSPQIIDLDVPESATAGETFTVSVTATNGGGRAGNWSTISVSSPTLDDAGDHRLVSITHEDFSEWDGVVPKGDPVIDIDGNRRDAQYVIIEAGTDDNSYWESGSEHRLDVEFTPENVGQIVVDVRVTMTAESDATAKYTSPVSSEYTDQQGYPVRRYRVKVKPPNAEKSLEGQVVDVRGNPVSQASVELYATPENFDTPTPTLLAKTRTDTEGYFEITSTPQQGSLVLVRDGEEAPYWFSTYELDPTAFEYSQELTLSRQMLSESSTAVTTEGQRIGSVSMWRYVNPSDHAEQVFYTEISETVPTETDTIWRVQETNRPLNRGIVSLTVPDEVLIAYRERDIDVPTGTLRVSSIRENTNRPYAAQWHQAREPRLPSFELAPAGTFSVVTKTEVEQGNSNWFLSVLSLIFGRIGSLALVGVVIDIFGLLLSLPSGEEDVDSVNLVGPTQVVDLNENDVVSSSWSVEHRRRRERPSAIVHQVPLRFESSKKISCTVEAGWELYSDNRARFSEQISVDELRVFDSDVPDSMPDLPHLIRIVDPRSPRISQGREIEYTIEVSGEILRVNEDGTIETNDRVNRGIVKGAVDHDTDEYRFSGRIIAFEIDQPRFDKQAEVYLDGERVNPGRIVEPTPSHELRIEAGRGTVRYQLTATERVYGESLNSEAEIGRYRVSSEITRGRDVLTIAGEIAYLDVTGDATVYLDGLQIDPSRLGGEALTNRITVDGTELGNLSRKLEYSFSVTGFVVPVGSGSTLEAPDTIEHNRVFGTLSDDIDEYQFSGELDSFSLEDTYYTDNVEVLLNGEPVEIRDYAE